MGECKESKDKRKSNGYKAKVKLYLCLSFILIVISTWVWNLSKFSHCDFEPNYRCEALHGVGVFIPPASLVTTWYNFEEPPKQLKLLTSKIEEDKNPIRDHVFEYAEGKERCIFKCPFCEVATVAYTWSIPGVARASMVIKPHGHKAPWS